jgi:hypothetical protein
MDVTGMERNPLPISQGRLQAWRARWFGERDTVAEQLADIARQGASMAKLAHVCASLMLLLFSAGSLVALGGREIDAREAAERARESVAVEPVSCGRAQALSPASARTSRRGRATRDRVFRMMRSSSPDKFCGGQ